MHCVSALQERLPGDKRWLLQTLISGRPSEEYWVTVEGSDTCCRVAKMALRNVPSDKSIQKIAVQKPKAKEVTEW